MNLKERLIKERKIRWLDIGCNRNFEEGFYYMDRFPKNKIDPKHRSKYFKISILTANENRLKSIGKFDLVRMQHILEHFAYEDGITILKNVAKILAPNGIILITVPDLKININKYLTGGYRKWKFFKSWANKRVSNDAPLCFYFSIYSHSLLVTPHKWCYDVDGLKYLLNLSGYYKNIKELKFNDKLASYPFTHNRPEEDTCAMAKIN